MRLDQPRIQPLSADEIPDAAPKQLLEGPILNIFGTLARHPTLLSRWMDFAIHIMMESTLSPRERELVILRVGWLSRSGYEWGQHVEFGRRVGLDDADFDRVREGPAAEGWSERERALLQATDELHGDAFVSDETWAQLDGFTDEQKLDFVFTVGQYMLVSMALNTLGVQPDEGFGGLESGGGPSSVAGLGGRERR